MKHVQSNFNQRIKIRYYNQFKINSNNITKKDLERINNFKNIGSNI